jgi:hypothetical protein
MNVHEIRHLLSEVKYLDWIFFVAPKSDGVTPDYLQVKFEAPCTTHGQQESWAGRKWLLSKWMTPSEVVTTAFKAVLTAVEHEARESFRYKGQQIFGPHLNVELMVNICERMGRDALDARPPTLEIEHGTRKHNNIESLREATISA